MKKRPRITPTLGPNAIIAINPDYVGREPTPLKATCHDGTPFISVECVHGHRMHMHESQLPAEPSEMHMRCIACMEIVVMRPGQAEAAFAKMRADGWIE